MANHHLDNISNTALHLSKVMDTLLHHKDIMARLLLKDLLRDNMERRLDTTSNMVRLLTKAMVTLLLKDLHQANMARLPSKDMEPRLQASMEHLLPLTAAINKHPQARLRRPALATCLDRRHPSTCLALLTRFAKP